MSHKLARLLQSISSLIHRSLHILQQSQWMLFGAPSRVDSEVGGEDELATRYPGTFTREYYQQVHEDNAAYKTNNWLVSEIDAILSISPRSLLEVGCGNGRFLAALDGRVERAIGVDWARSPIIDEIGISESVLICDITCDDLPKADLVCSADVLEHIAPNLLRGTIEHLDKAGLDQYHVVACYDDGHSHLSILQPQAWLELFQSVSPRYQIIDVRPRRGDPSQVICVIATFQPDMQPTSDRVLQARAALPSTKVR